MNAEVSFHLKRLEYNGKIMFFTSQRAVSNSLFYFSLFPQMPKCTAQNALRNAPFFCIKYELMYSDAKSRDRFISASLFSAARTLGRGEGHVVGLRVA